MCQMAGENAYTYTIVVNDCTYKAYRKTYIYLIEYFHQERDVLGYERKLTKVGPGTKVLPSFELL